MPDTSDTSAILVGQEQHKYHQCKTSEKRATTVEHECYTNDTIVKRVKNFYFDNDTSENIFSTPAIAIWQMKD